jgi:hypothetical protein
MKSRKATMNSIFKNPLVVFIAFGWCACACKDQAKDGGGDPTAGNAPSFPGLPGEIECNPLHGAAEVPRAKATVEYEGQAYEYDAPLRLLDNERISFQMLCAGVEDPSVSLVFRFDATFSGRLSDDYGLDEEPFTFTSTTITGNETFAPGGSLAVKALVVGLSAVATDDEPDRELRFQQWAGHFTDPKFSPDVKLDELDTWNDEFELVLDSFVKNPDMPFEYETHGRLAPIELIPVLSVNEDGSFCENPAECRREAGRSSVQVTVEF